MRLLIFFVISTFCFSCKTKSALPNGCKTIGTVKDFTELDGCGMLIELENGQLLNPVKMSISFPLEAEVVVSFDYKILEGRVSSCMREKAMVEITCIVSLGKTPSGEGMCVDTNNPFEVPWMDQAIDRHNPNQVLKFQDGNEWAYLFRGLPSSYLYNCRGKLICETKNNHDKCQDDHLNRLGQGKIIWQGEGVWD